MQPFDYRNRIYENTWERNEYFEDYNDKDNFFIELTYEQYKGYWKSRASSRPALDWDIVGRSGEKIFKDADMSIFPTRNYVLLYEKPATNADEDGNILKITEVYGFAPNKEFEEYTYEKVPVWGLKDSDYSTKAPVPFNAQAKHIQKTQFFNRARINVGSAAARFKSGEEVALVLNGRYGYKYGIFAEIIYRQVACEFGLTIARIMGNYLEFTGELGGYQWSQEWYDEYDENQRWESMDYVFRCLNGNPSTTRDLLWRPTSGYILKEYSERSYKTRMQSVHNTIKYTLTRPKNSEIEQIFYPQNGIGKQYDVITMDTEPNHTEWKKRVANDEEFVAFDPEIKIDRDTGLYITRTKKAFCR